MRAALRSPTRTLVVRPFYRDHIARLDRQIVLVDVLTALNAGPDAVRDLERALAAILDSFNVGRNSILSALFAPRIDRILFAATKADLLHHTSHDRLERILDRLVERRGRARANFPAPTSTRSRWLRCARPARPMSAARMARCRRSSACRSRASMPAAAVFDGKSEIVDLSRRPAGRSGDDLHAGERGFRGLNAGAVRRGRLPLPALPSAASRTHRCGRARPAPYPSRSRARIPDRRPPAMTARPRKPADILAGRSECGRQRGTGRSDRDPAMPSRGAIAGSGRGDAGRRRALSLAQAVLFGRLGGLVSLGIGLAVTKLIEDLFARFGRSAGSALRSAGSRCWRCSSSSGANLPGCRGSPRSRSLRERAAKTLVSDDRAEGQAIVRELLAIESQAPHLARSRAEACRRISPRSSTAPT